MNLVEGLFDNSIEGLISKIFFRETVIPPEELNQLPPDLFILLPSPFPVGIELPKEAFELPRLQLIFANR